MPIDASIPLSVRPPDVPDPVEQYGRILSLKNMQAQQQQQQQLAPLILQQHRLQLSQEQMQQRQMQQDQKDEEIGGRAYNEAKGHPEDFLKLAGDYGMSQRGLARARQNMAAQQLALVKQHTADTKLQSDQLALTGQRHDKWADNLTAFMKRPDDDSAEGMKANWSNLLESGYRDKLSTDDEHAQALKQYPTFPGREAVEQLRNANASQGWFAKQGTADKNTQAANKEKTEQTRAKLLAAQTPAQYAEIAEKSGLPAGTFPAFGQMFDEQGDPVQAQMTGLNRMGMTSAQRETADAAALRARELKQREDRMAAHQNELEGRGDSPAAELIRQRRQQTIDAGEQKKWEDIDKAKVAGEKDLRGKRDAEVARLLKDTGFDTEGQASDALAAKTASAYSKKQAQKAIDAIKGINRKYAPQLQGVQGRYANSIRARKGKAVDYDVDPDTLSYRERAAKGGEPDDADEATPPASPKPAKPTATAAPAATPQRMQNAAGHVIEYDPKLNKWVDANTRKPVQ